MSDISRSSTSLPSSLPSPWRSAGIWMIVILVAYILFNAVRSVLNPAEFAINYGLPLSNTANNGFVFVYSIRALFLGLFGMALLISKNYRTLALYALIASVMPIGDAILVGLAGGSVGTVIRHALTAVFLVLTWFFMRRWVQSAPETQ